MQIKYFKSYGFPLLLVFSIICGGLLGYNMGANAIVLKPLGDILLNLIFTAIVPLVFFSIASSVAQIGEPKALGKMLGTMTLVFIFTGIIAAVFMIFMMKAFPLDPKIFLQFTEPTKFSHLDTVDQLVNVFTVSDFSKLLSHDNMLALIVFAILIGLSTAAIGEKGKLFANFLKAGAEVCMKLISLIMLYAPIGFFAYFAVLIGQVGSKLIAGYVHVTIVYYVAAIIYFIFAYTFYAYLAGGKSAIGNFWKNVLIPMLTALATCSSAASIPVNIEAAKKIGVQANISETVIPLGSILHKDGSVLGAIVKIAFLFSLFHLNFSGIAVLSTALIIGLLVGTVMGAIPSGGMLGEMLILSLYGFPAQSLIIIAAISVIIDPIATMLNVTGNTVCSLLIARFMTEQDELKIETIELENAS